MVQCSNQYGGLFDEGSSTSWNATTYSALNTAVEAVSDQGSDLWGTDIIKINTTFSLPNFPIGIFRSDAPNSAGAGNIDTLGLGRNSTLLNVLSSVGVIASRTYGYFQGWTGAYAKYQTDGSLVLGGYDAAKVTGSNVTLPFAPSAACNNGYVITVTDIKMNLKNGSNPSIIGQSAGSSLKACIEPDFGPITLSEDIWWAFTNITGVGEIGRSLSPLNFFGMLIPAGGAYDGDLTFNIYPDLEITIPNHQLVVPDIEINPVGQEVVSNYTKYAEVLINSLQADNANDIPRFGMPFLSSAYLMVDNDNQQFTLWASQQSQSLNLVELGPPTCRPPVATSTPTPNPLPSVLAPPPPSGSNNGPSKAAIAGGSIGGLAAISLCIGAFILRKRRRRRQQEREKAAPAEPVIDSMYSDTSAYYKPEMPSDRQPPQEMPLVPNPEYTLAPYELPFEAAHELPPAPPEKDVFHEMPATPRSRR
ncbi:hypothetical protein OEA41_000844 [Lepraria neglecta]|uniref:Peptidase A1 domain-containing protein n=1 Tax=Lepraria neglecta TaxID=209136 RepID=A0AAE0DQ69_9LECA|nr:hypothetical protein OEA41_000844 [Lepraria neglecta]